LRNGWSRGVVGRRDAARTDLLPWFGQSSIVYATLRLRATRLSDFPVNEEWEKLSVRLQPLFSNLVGWFSQFLHKILVLCFGGVLHNKSLSPIICGCPDPRDRAFAFIACLGFLLSDSYSSPQKQNIKIILNH
jgi:hypothetical protein